MAPVARGHEGAETIVWQLWYFTEAWILVARRHLQIVCTCPVEQKSLTHLLQLLMAEEEFSNWRLIKMLNDLRLYCRKWNV